MRLYIIMTVFFCACLLGCTKENTVTAPEPTEMDRVREGILGEWEYVYTYTTGARSPEDSTKYVYIYPWAWGRYAFYEQGRVKYSWGAKDDPLSTITYWGRYSIVGLSLSLHFTAVSNPKYATQFYRDGYFREVHIDEQEYSTVPDYLMLWQDESYHYGFVRVAERNEIMWVEPGTGLSKQVYAIGQGED